MDARILRELELDGVARLYGWGSEAPAAGPAPAPAVTPPAPRTVVARTAAGTSSCLVVTDREVLEGASSKLLDAMLASIGLRRVDADQADAAQSRPALALIFGDHSPPDGIASVAISDPRHLIEHPAGKARAWENLSIARRRLAAT